MELHITARQINECSLSSQKHIQCYQNICLLATFVYPTASSNPKAPWKGTFLNLHRLEWDTYDLDWPEFNKRAQAYLNIGEYHTRFSFANID